MDIITLKFAGITVAATFIYYLLNHKYRIAFLAVLSYAFIASFNLILLPYVLVFALINYYIGLKLPGARRKTVLYRTGIILNIIQLVLLKYASFAIDPIFNFLGSEIVVSKLAEIIVPIGISYFTLQGIGYLINVKLGLEQPEKKVLDFLLYIGYFPKFLSGPVERSNHFLPQLKEKQSFNSDMVSEGLRIALFGFLKKIAIANQLAPFVIATFSNVSNADGSTLLLLLFFLPVYLYFDFSGYTDIAIGFSRMFGINLLPNFDRPFFAENVTTFWKKFHISLASWFGDYIFRQTILKRRKWGIYASVYAVFITWVLFGIWHGGGWNFMFLGLLQALAINYEFLTKRWRYRVFAKVPGRIKTWFSRIVTYLFYGASLVFFFSEDLNSVFTYFSGLFHIEESLLKQVLTEIPLSALGFALLYFVYELIQEDFSKADIKLKNFWSGDDRKSRAFRWTLYSLILAIVFVLGNQVQQFIYVQF